MITAVSSATPASGAMASVSWRSREAGRRRVERQDRGAGAVQRFRERAGELVHVRDGVVEQHRVQWAFRHAS